ncbi:MAG: RNA-directed DNA polymerase [Rhodopirellula sp.]|nr:RNA-directed DNA polymerase [Rhodopirellula sp.]
MPSEFIRKLSWVLLAGRWERGELENRGRLALRRATCPMWMVQLANRLIVTFGDNVTVPQRRQLELFLSWDAPLQKRIRTWDRNGSFPKLVVPPQRMAPAADRFIESRLPELTTTSSLAAWLSISPSELDWFADQRRWERRQVNEAARHYRYLWIPKSGGMCRLLESPKPRLKAMQREILDCILAKVPVHDAAHGFCRGRSVRTYLEPHVGRDIVFSVDLRQFFPSVRVSQINAIFRTVGYPEEVARMLTGLCTNSTPENVLHSKRVPDAGVENSRMLRRYRDVHLPQGTPTSPMLANLAAFRLDRRLTGLASKFGASYTRYADDLTFSGDSDFRCALERFKILVYAIVIDQGFEIRHRKTRVMTQGQRQLVTGLVLNNRLNVPRNSFDVLKATLHNCVRFGPSSQNREAIDNFSEHLAGRISWVDSVSPARGAKLKALFNEIDWSR